MEEHQRHRRRAVPWPCPYMSYKHVTHQGRHNRCNSSSRVRSSAYECDMIASVAESYAPTHEVRASGGQARTVVGGRRRARNRAARKLACRTALGLSNGIPASLTLEFAAKPLPCPRPPARVAQCILDRRKRAVRRQEGATWPRPGPGVQGVPAGAPGLQAPVRGAASEGGKQQPGGWGGQADAHHRQSI